MSPRPSTFPSYYNCPHFLSNAILNLKERNSLEGSKAGEWSQCDGNLAFLCYQSQDLWEKCFLLRRPHIFSILFSGAGDGLCTDTELPD